MIWDEQLNQSASWYQGRAVWTVRPYFEQTKGVGPTEVVDGELADILHTSEVGLSLFFFPRKSPQSPPSCVAQLSSHPPIPRVVLMVLHSCSAAYIQTYSSQTKKKKKLTDIAGPADRMLWLGFFYFCFIFFFFFCPFSSLQDLGVTSL